MSFYLKQLELGPMQNFIYLVGDSELKECAVIDPAWEVEKILQVAEQDGMKICKIFITHGHPDHINGVEALLQKTACKIYVQKREAEFMRFGWPDLVKCESGDTIDIGKIQVRVIHTPGHTPGSQCFYVDVKDAKKSLISGDTLFINSCGRIDLPGSNPEEMYESLMVLKNLEDQTILYPGHNYSHAPASTMGEEKKNNPYLQFTSIQAFLKVVGGGRTALRWY